MKLRYKALFTALLALVATQCYAWMAMAGFWAGPILVVASFLGTSINNNTVFCANAPVNDVVAAGPNRIVIGGGFTRLGTCQFGAFPLNYTNGGLNIPGANALSNDYNWLNNITVSIPDGSGGWFIGGTFQSVGGVSRGGLARINADGTLNAWAPSINSGQVDDMVISGTTIYVGGSFTSINGTTRNRAAGINTSTGVVTSWNPNVNDSVYEMALISNTVYLAGSFTKVGGTTRNRLAAYTTAGVLTSWNPNPNGTITAMAVDTSVTGTEVLYTTGFFSTISSVSRNGNAAYINNTIGTLNISATDQTILSIKPWPLLSSGRTSLYIGGLFTQVGTTTRYGFAHISGSTLSSFQLAAPAGNFYVADMAMQSNTVYVNGQFPDPVRGTASYLQAYDLTTGSRVSSWDPNLIHVDPDESLNNLNKMSLTSTSIMFPALYLTNNVVDRKYIAAVDTATNTVTSWNPAANDVVYQVRATSDTVYAAGRFTTIGGQSRSYLAALDATTGLAKSFNSNVNAPVTGMVLANGLLYTAGQFTTVNSLSRNGLAAVNVSTGVPTSWAPAFSGTIYALAADASKLYVGGYFTNIGGAARSNAAAFDFSTGSISSWDPQPDDAVYAVQVSSGVVYMGGDFANINGTARAYAGAVNASTAAVTSWAPQPDSSVMEMEVSNSSVYLSGYFTSLNSGSMGTECLGKTNTTDGSAISSFQLTGCDRMDTSKEVEAFATSNGNLYAGGRFTYLGGSARSAFSVINATTGIATY